MARLSLIGLLAGLGVGATACGALLATDDEGDDAPRDDGGSADGGSLDGSAALESSDDGSTVDLTSDASAFEGGVCPPGAPWTDKGGFSMPANDVRSVRRVGDTYYYAYDNGGTYGIELGAAPAKANGAGGSEIGWFGSIDGPDGQTFPAVTADGLELVYQLNVSGTSALVRSKRSTPTQPWPSASPLTYNMNVGEASEPFITASGDLWFTDPDGLVKHATMTGTNQVDIVKTHAELMPARFPVVSADGLEIIFTRNEAKQNVYSATRSSPSASFGSPALVATLNEVDRNTRVAWISKDSCTLYFVRNDSRTAADPFKFHIALR